MKPRTAIMRRIRNALPDGDVVHTQHQMEETIEENKQVLVAEFSKELESLKGTMLQAPNSDVAELVAGLLREREANQLMAWDPDWIPVPGLLNTLEQQGHWCISPQLPRVINERRSRLQELGQAQVGITGAGAAISEIGTLVLPGGAGRSRLASVLPPIHIAIVTPDQFFRSIAAWMYSQRNNSMFDYSSSLTFVAGPSRTADVERIETLGAHGPREVIVICTDPPEQ